MTNKTILVTTQDSKLADIIANHVADRFSLIIEKSDGSSWKGYRLYFDAVDSTQEQIEYVRGFAHGILFTLTNKIF